MASVYLDYGHGGSDPGALGNGLKEKDLTLSIGRVVAKTLRDHGVTVYESRTSDKTLSLDARTNDANKKKSDILVSIHINSFSVSSASGVETFSYPGSKNGALLAKLIQEELVHAKLFNVNRGVKTANFHMLRVSNMPGALTELGFISNTSDVAVLRTKQTEVATSVSKGILRYLGIKYSLPNPRPSKPIVKPQTASKGTTFFRVVTESFESREKAVAYQKVLKEKGIDSFLDVFTK